MELERGFKSHGLTNKIVLKMLFMLVQRFNHPTRPLDQLARVIFRIDGSLVKGTGEWENGGGNEGQTTVYDPTE
jgi:hypothetical protein